jgi:hypothetical protein
VLRSHERHHAAIYLLRVITRVSKEYAVRHFFLSKFNSLLDFCFSFFKLSGLTRTHPNDVVFPFLNVHPKTIFFWYFHPTIDPLLAPNQDSNSLVNSRISYPAQLRLRLHRNGFAPAFKMYQLRN